jgi:tetratricopeptide (TPR) repeat protein
VGQAGSPCDLRRHSVFLEAAGVECGPGGDIALAAYVVARLVDRLLGADADKSQALAHQVEAARGHLSDLLATDPEVAHLRRLVDAAARGRAGIPPLRTGLVAYAAFLEHQGRLAEALDISELVARSYGEAIRPVEVAACALVAGRLNRLLARWEAASACYAAAEQAGREAGDPVLRLRGRLGQGAVLRGKGNLKAAQAIAEEVRRDAGQLGIGEVESMAYADLGSALWQQGLRLEALAANYRAFELAIDPGQRMRALGDVGIGLAEIGALDAARTAFGIVVASNAKFGVRLNAVLELLDLESQAGNRAGFDGFHATAESAGRRMPPSLLVDFHYKAGVGFARFGEFDRARDALTAGLRLAEENRLNAWAFRLERVLANLRGCTMSDLEAPGRAALRGAPVVEKVTTGLRAYAALASPSH